MEQKEPEIRIVDTREYVSVLRDLVLEGEEVSMNIAGSSMSPFVENQRDRIVFKAPDRELRKGDFVFYQRTTGQFVCHRIYKIKPEGYYMVGDNQTDIEGPLQRSQIFALIVKIQRKGKWIAPGDFWWEFFEKVWIRIIPLRRGIQRIYSIFSKVTGRGK